MSFSQQQRHGVSISQKQGATEASCEGYLEKQTHNTIKRWLPRYFELQTDALRYYDAKGSTNSKGEVPVSNIEAFDKFVEGDYFIMMLTLVDGKNIKLRARDEENAAKWKDAFSKIAGPANVVESRRARVEYWKSRASQMLTTSSASEALKARVKGKLKDMGTSSDSKPGRSASFPAPPPRKTAPPPPAPSMPAPTAPGQRHSAPARQAPAVPMARISAPSKPAHTAPAAPAVQARRLPPSKPTPAAPPIQARRSRGAAPAPPPPTQAPVSFPDPPARRSRGTAPAPPTQEHAVPVPTRRGR
jgi:hypothetical protein